MTIPLAHPRLTGRTNKLFAILLVGLLLGEALLLAAGPTAAAELEYGPDTCLTGYVWREAVHGDLVCVTPDQRDQAVLDNAAAASRVDASGAYGPDSCVSGFVWREATPTDHVCVTPETRTRVSQDNNLASERTVLGGGSMEIWLSGWRPGPQCSDGVCTSTSTDDIPRVKVSGGGFTDGGQVVVVIGRLDTGAEEWRETVVATAHDGFAGGSFGLETPIFDCSSDGPATHFVAATDLASGASSALVEFRKCGAVL